ncbi:MAG: hypothetical protein AVDCRST_MAG93-5520, partial [uncultured Chloroflexia bacterium]
MPRVFYVLILVIGLLIPSAFIFQAILARQRTFSPVLAGTTTLAPTEFAPTTQVVNPLTGHFKWQAMTSTTTNAGEPLQAQIEPALDAYDRWTWSELESTPGVYKTGASDPIMQAYNLAVSQGRRYAFRVRLMKSGSGSGTFMPSDLAVAPYGWRNPAGGWIPDWNNTTVLNRFEALMSHLATRFDGKLAYLDIGYYGSYGEWHTYGIDYSLPAARGFTPITQSSTYRIVDHHLATWPNTQLLSFVANEDAVKRALNATHTYPVGLRVDSLGSSTDWDNALHTRHTASVQALIAARWKTAPLVAEYWGDRGTNSPIFATAQQQIVADHVLAVSNGNFGTWSSFDAANRAKALENGRTAGYRFVLGAVDVPPLTAGATHTLMTRWHNRGVTPVYTKWDVMWQLHEPGSGALVWTSGPSGINLRSLLPTGTTPASFSVNLALPRTLAAQSYEL